MSDWIHWNGLVKEAEELGVSRRISLRDARKMTWGDVVYTAMLDGKTGVIFGYFKVNRITGLDEETVDFIKEKHETNEVDEGGNIVERGCGEYKTGPTISVDASIEGICNDIDWVERKRIGCTIESISQRSKTNKLMVAGPFTEIEPIRLMNIPFRQGFRGINGIVNGFIRGGKEMYTKIGKQDVNILKAEEAETKQIIVR